MDWDALNALESTTFERDQALGPAAVNYRTESRHGAGSSEAQAKRPFGVAPMA